MDQIFIIRPVSWGYYIFLSFIFSIAVRILITMWRNFETGKASWSLYLRILSGVGYHENILNPPIAADYLLGLVLGFLELLAYPILLRSGHAIYIGAWLAFKTAHRWGYAPEYKRGTFNRYLVGNAFILCISFIMALLYIDP